MPIRNKDSLGQKTLQRPRPSIQAGGPTPGWLARLERRRRFRLATASWRVLPDFLVAGFMKCGTTSLFDAIAAHPLVAPSATKEPCFFDVYYHRGERWYRSHFALRNRANQNAPRRLACEGTPTYLLHPLGPSRMAGLVPDARLILILRDPLDRAYSHYQHVVRSGKEPLAFEEALEAEAERLQPILERIKAEPAHHPLALFQYSYAGFGRYADHIERCLRHFTREQLLVLTLDQFERAPGQAFEQISRFLELPISGFGTPAHLNRGGYPPFEDALRRRLSPYFQSQEQQLNDLLGTKLTWRE